MSSAAFTGAGAYRVATALSNWTGRTGTVSRQESRRQTILAWNENDTGPGQSDNGAP
jgi:hypothetical protein